MTKPDKRQNQNTILRERIDRLQHLHAQLQALTSQAFDDVLRQVRGSEASDARQTLDTMINGYIDTLRRHQSRIEQEFASLSQDNLLTDEELAALIEVSQISDKGRAKSKPSGETE